MNFRCPPEVVGLANNLIGHNFLRTSQKAPLKPTRKSPGADVVRLLPVFDDWDAEAAGVASDISDRHADHLGSVVVLARSRRLLEGVAHALEGLGIAATIAQRKDEFQSTPLVWLHAVLRLANEKRDRASLESLCGAFAQMTCVQVDPDEILTQEQASGIGFLQEWIRRAQSSTGDRRVTNVVSEVSAKLVVKREYVAFCSTAFAWIDGLIEEQRKAAADPSEEVFAGYAVEKAVWNELSREIVSSLGEDISLEAFLQELQMHSKEPTPKPNSAVLMTIHGAKGKEFDHVYLVGLVDDELPSFQSKKKGDRSPEMEEERRNCFVAITRTMSTLTLSYAEKYRGWPKKPSRFLFEMGLLEE
jgi:DNA helicase-2/ATP-dependent DNA helicase PcrA